MGAGASLSDVKQEDAAKTVTQATPDQLAELFAGFPDDVKAKLQAAMAQAPADEKPAEDTAGDKVAKSEEKPDAAEAAKPDAKDAAPDAPPKVTRALSQAASQARGSLKKNDLTEIRSLGKPPAGVMQVMSILLRLLGETKKEIEWKDVQVALSKKGGSEFIDRLMELETAFNNGEVPEEQIEAARKIKDEMGDSFDAEAMNKVSRACGSLVKFASEMF